MSIVLASVFIEDGEPAAFRALPVGSVFMVADSAQMNRYWRTPKQSWQPYLSSIVFRKESCHQVQRLMTAMPTPLEAVSEQDLIVYPVRFIG